MIDGSRVPTAGPGVPILLFDDECSVCCRLAAWVRRSASRDGGPLPVDVRAIGEDPAALRALNPALDIWDAYGTIHLLMPNGSMRIGGAAIAELLRRLPNTRGFARVFALRVLGAQPFQWALDRAYALLAALRPVLGCESCGRPSAWLRPLAWVVARFNAPQGPGGAPGAGRHSTPRRTLAGATRT